MDVAHWEATPRAGQLVDRLIHVLHVALREGIEAGPRALQFRRDTEAIRQTPWAVAPPPPAFVRRRVELLVPPHDGEAVQEACAAQPDVLILDLDDTFAPSWVNLQRAYAVFRQLPALLPDNAPPVMLRPRPLWLREPQVLVDGEPALAPAVDLAYFLSAVHAGGRSDPIGIYIPKVATLEEAVAWDHALANVEAVLGWPSPRLWVTVQIEQAAAIFQAEEILWAVRDRALGLNAGRWDYLASVIRTYGRTVGPVPPREQLRVTLPCFAAYARHLVRVCQRRGAQAIGGVLARAPATDPALALADKQWEVQHGFMGAWAGHPQWVPVVRQAFQESTPTPLPGEDEEAITTALRQLPAVDQLACHDVRRTITRLACFLGAWRRGVGTIVHEDWIEDLSTAELARAQLWQWRLLRVRLDTGEELDEARYIAWCHELAPRPVALFLEQLTAAEQIAVPLPAQIPPGAKEEGKADD